MANLRRNLTRESALDLLRHGLSTVAFSCLIAAALALSGRGRWDVQLVYSLAIGMISWFVIDIGRLALSDQSLWPHGARGFVLVIVGIATGFFGGNAIGDAYSGAKAFDFLHSHSFASTIVITVLAGIAICYFYYSRGKSKYLEGEIALAQRDAADARLKLLETQLEPHMLFNTLANLRALIATDPPRAIAMLDRLNGYLRVTLSGSRALSHPLAAEFERLSDYLELMAVRMGDRLRFVLELPDALRAVPVPPLMLQPLVENSIRHGLEPKVEGGQVTVRARQDGKRLVIELIDTGVGIDAPAGDAPSAGGFGVAQVRERLETIYGAEASLALSTPPGGGVCATIVLPLGKPTPAARPLACP
ncbi:sensor histidine kinase [Variovorax jilinensis]|uniref:sensor histidine kinase n=1 Tax=Variovorax jilinensis TaxID=3053513 RepID=UPI004037EAEC